MGTLQNILLGFFKYIFTSNKMVLWKAIYNIWGETELLKYIIIQLSELCLLKLWHLDAHSFSPFPYVHCWGQFSHWVPW